jgi:hypothetical protein
VFVCALILRSRCALELLRAQREVIGENMFRKSGWSQQSMLVYLNQFISGENSSGDGAFGNLPARESPIYDHGRAFERVSVDNSIDQ